MQTEEIELVKRTLEGDLDAFGSLYQTHQSRIFATVRGRTRNQEDAEDLVQTTFIRAYLGLSGYRGEAAFSTWLTQIAMNLCTSHSRSKKALNCRIDAVEDPCLRHMWEPARGEDPAERLDRKEHTELLMQHIRDLPTPYREAMELRYVQDRSYLEITEVLKVPMGTVKSWLHRARHQLEQTLENSEFMHP
jgi:RNA polymerase sigma-70 factor (ECF subfamily)